MAEDAILTLVSEAKMENIALQTICSSLIGEIANLHEDPSAKLNEITARLRAVAAGVAQGAHEPVITAVVDRVCATAEAGFVKNEPLRGSE